MIIDYLMDLLGIKYKKMEYPTWTPSDYLECNCIYCRYLKHKYRYLKYHNKRRYK